MLRVGLNCGVVALMMLFSACGASRDEAAQAPPAETVREPTVFDDQTATMDRARAVQGTVDQHARDLEQAEEQAQGR